MCPYLQDPSAKPLAAVAAVAAHCLLALATRDFAAQPSQGPINGHGPTAGSPSLALMLSALAAVKALVAAREPILDAPVLANIFKLLQQLLDKVKRLRSGPFTMMKFPFLLGSVR